jgi:hypothetical protein
MTSTTETTTYTYQEDALHALIDYIEQEQIDLFHQQFENDGGDENKKNNTTTTTTKLLDQIFCSFTDLQKNDMGEHILHGLLYITAEGLAFSGTNSQFIEKKSWKVKWDSIDQFRVVMESNQMLLYMILRKDTHDVTSKLYSYMFTIDDSQQQQDGFIFANEVSTTEEELTRNHTLDQQMESNIESIPSTNIQDINLHHIRKMRWRSFLYTIRQHFRYRCRTTNEMVSHFVIKTEEELEDDLEQKRAFIYNLKYFKGIKFMELKPLEFNSNKGEVEETTSIASERRSEQQIEEAPRLEEEQEYRVNKTTARSIIIKDYFEAAEQHDDETTYTEYTEADEMSEVPQDSSTSSSRPFFKRLFQGNVSPISPPVDPSKAVLLEYKNVRLIRKQFLNMSVKQIPAVLRVEEDRFSRQATIAVYKAFSKSGRLLEKNIHAISDIKKIEVLNEPPNGLLSLELLIAESDELDKWVFDQTPADHYTQYKSLHDIVKEIREIYYSHSQNLRR